jgi:hypothetical protein
MKRKRLLTTAVLVTMLITACASEPSPAAQQVPARRSIEEASAPKEPAAAVTDRGRATEAMDKAKSLKADVAVKKEFEAAQALFDEAEALSAESEEEAAQKYLEAEIQFNTAYEDAVAKREEALRQLNLARDAIKSVEDAARGEGALQ